MKPNIIYILSDQHNPTVMGNAGDPYIRTPNLDRLYREGSSLENCYCGSPLCVPSRSAMLSGLLPSHTGVYNNMQALPTCNATFVNSLTVGGYETALSGRMHFVGWDQRHGFEKRLVGDITPCFVGGDNEREIYGDFMRSSGQNMTSIRKSGAGHSAVLDFDRDVTDAACTFLKEREADRPLFLTVGFYGPHCPYIAPKELYDYYYQRLEEIPFMDLEAKQAMHPAIRSWYDNRSLEAVTPADVKRIRAAYYAMVEYMDSLVGEVLSTIEQTLDMDNTLIIYGSDHGDNIGEHGLFWKTNFYEGSAHVPMVFVKPGMFPAGKKIDGLTSLLDLAPTLLELTQSPELPRYDGISLLPYLLGEQSIAAERPVVSLCSDIKGDAPSAMIRIGRYKLMEHAGYETCQLFDLEKDPKELQDLGTEEQYAAIVQELKAKLSTYWNPAQAIEELKQSKVHFSLMKKWFDITKPDLVEEWRGDSSLNCLL
jgi:choline-sulfatase